MKGINMTSRLWIKLCKLVFIPTVLLIAFFISTLCPKILLAADKAEKEYILIGHPNPSTGPLSEMGEVSPWIDDQFVEKINAGGGIYIKEYGKKLPIKVKIVDTESNPTKAIRVATDLILQDKVDMMVVMHTPDTVNPVTAVCERYEIPCVSTQAPIDPWLSNGPYKWSFHSFWNIDSLADVYLGIWDINANQTNKVVGCLWPGDADGIAFSEVFNKKLPARGYKYVNYEGFSHGISDFSPAINLFKKENVEILTGVLIFPDWVNFWRQSIKLGFYPKIVTMAKAILFPSSVNTMVLEGFLPEGWTTEVWWNQDFPFKYSLIGHDTYDAKGLSENWSKDTGKQPTMVLGFVHAGFEIAIDALKRAQTLDKEKLRQAIEDTDLDTIIGHIKFNSENYCLTKLVGGQWLRGSSWPWELKVIYDPANLTTTKTQGMFFPMPKTVLPDLKSKAK
ncbi:MAG: ABC transporter substrate-binding protein [Candidatus Omnitrophota bacterium]